MTAAAVLALLCLTQAPLGVRPAAPAGGPLPGGAIQHAGGALAPGAVQMGSLVRPDTVTVGQPFEVTLRVRAPRGTHIAFPGLPDSTGPVEAVDPAAVTQAPDTTAVERMARYRLVAWDTGQVTIPFGPVVITTAPGVNVSVPVAGVAVRVRSVLPADSALRVPKPARDILLATPFPWLRWLAIAVGIIALLLAVWLWRRRRPRDGGSAADPLAEAESQFARIDSLGLLEAGERGRFIALNVEVLREYLARRVEAASRALTTPELLHRLAAKPSIPAERLAPVLHESDLVKFARRPVTGERAVQLAGEMRAVVRDTDASLVADEAARLAREAEAATAAPAPDSEGRAA